MYGGVQYESGCIGACPADGGRGQAEAAVKVSQMYEAVSGSLFDDDPRTGIFNFVQVCSHVRTYHRVSGFQYLCRNHGERVGGLGEFPKAAWQQ